LRGTRKVRAGLALHARRVRYPEGDDRADKIGEIGRRWRLCYRLAWI